MIKVEPTQSAPTPRIYWGALVDGQPPTTASFQSNGVFAGQQFGMTVMYSHGICTLMLAEVAGMTTDKKLAKEIRTKLVKAIEVILEA